MHVLFVLDTWGLIGGTERYASVVVPALAQRGHRVTILCREDQRPAFAEVEVLEFPELDAGSLDAATRERLQSALETAAPDVIFVSAMRNRNANEAFLTVAPVVRYVHDHVPFCPGLNKYCEDGETCKEPMGLACLRRYWLEGGCVCFKRDETRGLLFAPIRELRQKQQELDLVRRAARVLTNSRYMLGELLKLDFPVESSSVLHLFTESKAASQGELTAETQTFLDANPELPLLFTPARLTLPDKGVDYLLSSLAQLQSPFRAVIAGTGPAQDWLHQKAIEEGVQQHVHFAGWQSSPAIERLYGLADVVICPSVWDEPFGLVGLEAMAHAKPVVAFEVGGIPDWLEDKSNGFMVPRKDTQAMASAIDRCLTDPALGHELGRAGQRILEQRFSRDEHVNKLEQFLLEAARSI